MTWALAGMACAVLAGGVWFSLAPWQRVPFVLHRQRRNSVGSIGAALPDVIDELARGLRSGLTVPSALAGSIVVADGALRQDLDRLSQRMQQGASLEVAVAEWRRDRPDVHAVQVTGAAIVLAGEAGGSVARAMESVAATVRADLEMHSEARAMATQARASALLIAVLPVFFAFVGGVSSPRSLAFLVSSRVGLMCLCGGLVLNITGWFWMRRIVGGPRW